MVDSLEGNGDETVQLAVTTLKKIVLFFSSTVPGTPAGINLKEVTGTTIRFSFNEYPSANSYLVAISPADDDSVTYPDSNQQHTFVNLTQGQEYTITVTVVIVGSTPTQSLVVRTDLSQPGPITYNVTDTTPNSIMFEWTDGEGVFENYEVSVSTQGGLLVYNTTLNSTDDTSLLVEDLQPETTYTVVVVATAGSGGDKDMSDQREVDITTLPTVLSVTTIGEEFLLLQWSAQGGDVDHYKITYSPSDGDPSSPFDIPLGTNLKLINDLTPGQEYTITFFTVAPNNQETEKGSITQRTKPKMPGAIAVSSITSTQVVISWTAASPTGVFDNYRVTYSPDDGLTTSPVHVEPSTTQITLAGLTPATAYDVSVTAVSGTLESTASAETVATLAGSALEVYIIEVTTTSIWLKWSPAQGSFTGYSVRALNTDGDFKEYNGLSPSIQSHTLSDLTPGLKYTIFVSADGTVSSTTVAQYTRPNAPVSVSLGTPSSSGVTVVWGEPAESYDQYEVKVVLTSDESIVFVQTVPKGTTSFDVADLQPETSYRVEVVSEVGTDQERTLSEVVATTFMTDRSKVNIVDYNETTLSLSWELPASIPESIKVTLDPADGTPSSPITLTNNETSEMIMGLTPGEEYTAVVLAVKDDSSEEEIGRATQRLKPTATTNLTVTGKSYSSIDISWDYNPDEGDLYDVFEIVHEPADAQIGSPYLLDSYLPKSVSLMGLNPATNYNISVYAVSGLGAHPERSVPSEISEMTDVASPTDIIVKEVTTDIIRINWLESVGAQGYNVRIRETGSNDNLQSQFYTAGGSREHTFTGLTPGQLYTVSILISGVGSEPSIDQRTYPLRPGNLYPGTATATEINLAWDAAPGGVVDSYEVTYYPSEGTPSSPVHFAVSDELLLHLTMLRPDTVFTIVIVTMAGSGADQMTSQSRTTTQTTGSLNPLEIIIRRITSTEIDIMWGQGDDSGGIYLVALEESGSGSPDTTPVTAGAPLELSFTGLTPGSLYDITVTLNKGGTTTEESISARTTPLPVESISLSSSTVSSLMLAWTAPPNTTFDTYVLEYSPVGAAVPSPLELGSDQSSVELTSLLPNQVYDVSIHVLSGSGDDLKSSSTITEGFTTVRADPGEVVIIAQDETSIDITWGEADDNITFSGYLIRIEPADATTSIVWKLPSDERTHRFDSLIQGQEYTIYIQLQGADIETNITLNTDPLPIESLEISVTDSTSLLATWDHPEGVVRMYEVYSTLEGGVTALAGTVPGSDNTFALTGLNPGSTYTVDVYSTVGTGGGKISSDGVTANGTTAEVESNVVVIKSVTKNSIDIIWNTDLEPDPETQSFFLVELSPPDGDSYPQAVGEPARSYVEYTFPTLTSGRLYTITVSLGDNSNSITADVYTTPSAATSLSSTSQTTTTITLSWTAATGDSDGYIISYVDTDSTEIEAGTVASDTTTFEVTGLEPRTTYTFNVVTFVGSDSRVLSDMVSTISTTVSVPADTVVIQAFDTDSIEVLWAEVSDPSATGYLVSIDPADGENPSETRPDYIAKDTSRTSVKFTFENLVPGRLYTIKVQISGPNTYITESQRTLPEQIGNFYAGQTTSTTIQLYWDTVSQGEITAYRVQYVPSDGRTESPKVLPVVGTLGAITLEGLSPATRYTITVVSLAGSGADATESIAREYTQQTLPAEPAEVIIKDVDSTSITVTWGAVAGNVVGYLVRIDPAPTDTGVSSQQQFKANNEERLVDFTTLVPGELYTITVSVQGDDLSESAVQRTIPSDPGTVSVDSTTAVSVNITWEAASDVFDNYEVVYVRASDKQTITVGTVPSDQHFLLVDGLSPNSSYTMQVFTVSGLDQTVEKSGPSIVIATTDAIPEDQLLIQSHDTTSIDVLWSQRSEIGVNGYLISIDPADGGNPSRINQLFLPKENYRYTFDNLVPGREYTIRVEVMGAGEQVEASQRTEPLPPTAIVKTAETPTTITFAWTPASGDVDSYELSYSPEGGSETFLAVVGGDDTREYTLTQLDPTTSYTVYIKSISGALESSTTSQSLTTATIPAGDIVVSLYTTDTIDILWGAIEGATAYLLYLDGVFVKVVSSTERLEQSFTSLTPGQEYEIKIQISGVTVEDSVLNQRTKPNAVSQLNFQDVGASGHSLISFTWTNPGDVYDAFRLIYEPADGLVASPVEIPVESVESSYEFELTGLTPNTTYTITIVTLSGTGDSRTESSPYIQESTTDAAAPAEIIFKQTTTDSITIIWGGADVDFQLYLISYNPPDGNQDEYTLLTDQPDLDLELTYDGLTPGRQYTFTVSIRKDNQDLATDTEQQRTIPIAPATVVVLSRQSTSLEVTWSTVTQGHVDQYEVSYVPTDESAEEAVAGYVDAADPRLFTVSGLQSITEYSVLVRSVSGTGSLQTKSEAVSVVGTTKEIILTTLVSGTTLVILGWTEPAIAGEFTQYQIDYAPDDGTPSSGETYNRGATPSTRLQGTFSSLVPGKEYTFTLFTLNGAVKTQLDSITLQTEPLSPENLAATVQGPNSIEVTWEHPANGLYDSFKLTYANPSGNADGTLTSPIVFDDDDDLTVVLVGLEPNTVYDVSVVTMVGSTESQAAEISATTAVGEPGGINIKEVTSESIRITWNEPSPGTTYSGFTVKCEMDSTIIAQLSFDDRDPRNATFDGLTPGEMYKITVITHIPASADLTKVAYQITNPLAISAVNIDSVTPDSLELSWNAEGNYTSFEVTYDPADGSTASPSSVTEPHILLEGLSSQTEYAVTVVVVSDSAEADEMRSDPFTETIQTAKPPAGVINVGTVTATSIDITWGPSDDPAALLYSLIATTADSPIPITANIPIGDEAAYVFNNLIPGKLYTIRVTIEGTGISKEVQQRTLPTSPGQITVTEITQTTLAFRWATAVGDFDRYEIYFSSGASEQLAGEVDKGGNPEMTLENLTPGTEYTVNVYTVKGSGQHMQMSVPSTLTESTAEEILVFTLSGNILVVDWDIQTGDFDNYELTYDPANGNQESPIVISRGQATQVTIQDLVPGTMYDFSLSLVNSSDSRNVLITTPFNLPPLPVSGLAVSGQMVTSAMVAWSPQTGGIFDRYSLVLTNLDDDTDTQTMTVGKDGCPSVRLVNLSPSTNYNVKVMTVSARSFSMETSTNFSTGNQSSGSLYIGEITPTSLEVMWSEVLSSFEQYFVTTTDLDGSYLSSRAFLKEAERRLVLQGLTPGHRHRIKLDTLTSGETPNTEDTIEQATEPLPPGDISFTESSNTTVNITWFDAPGSYDGYKVCYGPTGNAPIVELDGDSNELELSQLNPTTEYIVSVSSFKTGGSMKVYSEKKTTYIKLSEGTPGDITIEDFTDSTITISWIGATSAEVTAYTVSVQTSGQTSLHTVDNVAIGTEPLTYTFTGLQPTVLYVVKVSLQGTLTEKRALQRTRPGAPGLINLLQPTAVSIPISWEAAAGDFDNYVVMYSDNSVANAPDTTAGIVDSSTQTLTIEDLKPDTEYQINVYARYGTGSRAILSAPSGTVARTAFVQPGSIVVVDVTSTSVEVVWGEVPAASGYFLNLDPPHGGSVSYPYFVTGESTGYLFDGLTPGVKYTINVRSVGGSGTPTDQTIEQHTEPLAVDGITVVNSTATDIIITWTPAAGEFDFYEVSRSSPDGPSVIGGIVPKDDERSVTFPYLDPETEYTISVVTVVGEGALQMKSAPYSMAASTVGLDPLEVIVINFTTNAITVLWGPTNRTDVTAYLINLSPSDGAQYPVAVTADLENRYDFTNLVPGREYTITLGVSQYPDENSINQRTVPNPPENLRSEDETTTSVTVKWDAPTTGDVDTYVMTYDPADGQTSSPLILSAGTTEQVIEGLTPSSSYNVSIKVVSGTGLGMTQSDDVTTEVTTSAAGPAAVIIKTVTTTSIDITWGAVPEGIPFDGYVIRHEPPDGNPSTLPLPADGARRVTFTGLMPGKLYTIYVNVQGIPIEGSVEQRTLPNAPGAISIDSTTSTSLTFSWTTTVGDFDYYEVSYAETGGATIIAGNIDSSLTSYTLDGLDSDTTYDIYLSSVKGGVEDKEVSAPSTGQGTTDAVPAEEILILEVTTTSITIEWGESENPFATNYAVLATPLSGGDTLTHVVEVGGEHKYTFTGLQTGVEYRIKLQIVVSSGEGSETTVSQFTKPSAPGAITIGTASPTVLPLSWEAAPGDYEFVYEISYAANGGVMSVADTVGKATTSYNLTGLLPDTSYDVSIVTKVGTGESVMESDPSTATGHTAIIVPGAIILDSVTSSSIEISWGGSDEASGYFVSLDPADDGNTYPEFLINSVTKYSFSGLTAGKEYTLTVSYTNAPIADAVTAVRTNPTPPGAITIDSTNPTEVTFSWIAATGDFANYEISYMPDGGVEVPVSVVESSVTTYTISELSPSTTYHIMVTTTVGSGVDLLRSVPSEKTFTTTTIPEGEIEVREVTSTSIHILWGVTAQGGALGYLLDIEPADGGSYPRVAQLAESSYTFQGLVPGREYTISLTVSCLVNVGDEIIQATEPNAPVAFAVKSHTPTTITVEWTAPEGEVTSYVLSYTDPNGQLTTAGTIPSSNTEYEFRGLEPSTEYTFTIKSKVVSNGNDVFSQERNVVQSTTIIPAGDIIVGEVTTSSISLLWGASTDEDVTGYLLTITPSGGGNVVFLQRETNRYTYQGLVSGTEYTIKVQLAGPNTASEVVVRTRPTPPGTITVDTQAETTLDISWDAASGDFSVYEISLEYPDSSVKVLGVVNKDSPRTFHIENLRPGTSYMIRIVTRFGTVGDYVRSEPSELTASTATIPPGQIEVVAVTTDSITILWGATDNQQANGYILLLTPAEGGSYPHYLTLDTITYTFPGLTPGRDYSITVQIAGPNVGQTITQQTKPNPPGSVAVTSSTPTSLDIIWEASIGEFDVYEIYYTQVGLQQQFHSTVNSDVNTVTIDSLIPNTGYVIEVASKSGIQKSDFASVEATTEIIPTAEIALVSVSTDEISIMWGGALPNTSATGYLVSIDPSASGPRFLALDTIEYSFTGLDAGVLYTITLDVLSSDFVGTFTQRTKPNSPVSVTSGSTTETSIDITIDGQATGSFDKYEIFYGRDANEAIYAGSIASDAASFDFTIGGLDPDTSYSIKVQTSAGSGDDIMTSDPFTLTASTVALGAANIVVLDVTTTSISIVWGPSAQGDGYFAIAAAAGETPKYASVPLGGSPKHQFTDLTPGTMYAVTVQVTGTAVAVTINQRTRPEAPSTVAVVDNLITTTSITVVWGPPAGDFDNYEVSYRDPQDVEHLVQVVDKQEFQLTIDGLDHSTTYTVSVVSKIGTGNDEIKSAPTSVEVTTAAIQAGEIIVLEVTTTEIEILWGPAAVTTVGYLVGYDPASTPIFTPGTEYRFTGLVPGREYEITVTPTADNNLKSSILQRTKPIAPGQITVDTARITPTIIPISWEAAEGDFEAYTVSYVPDGGSEITFASVASDVLSVTITGLEPGTLYEVRVVTVVNGASSEASTTQISTASLQPLEIAIVEYDTTSVSITWGQTDQPLAENYVIIATASGTDTQAVTKAIDEATLHAFSGLTPGRLYTITVQVTGNSGNLDESSITQRTIPLPVENIIYLSATSTSISLAWDPPSTSDFDGFEIYYATGEDQPTLAGTVGQDAVTFDVERLNEATTYQIDIVTLAGSGADLQKSSPRSTQQSTLTTILRVITSTSNFIFVQWIPQSFTFQTYTLTYDPGQGSPPSPITNIPKSQLTQSIVGLLPGEEYSLTLSAINFGLSTNLDSLKARTNPLSPGPLTIEDFGADFIEVSWTDPIGETVFDHFEITYTPSSGRTPQPLIRPKVLEKRVRVEGLDPSTQYTVSVVTVSGSSDSEKKSTIPSTATQVTAAASEGQIIVKSVTHDSIGIEWTRVSGAIQYTVEYRELPLGSATTTSTSSLQATLQGLSTGREYEIAVKVDGNAVDTVTQSTRFPNQNYSDLLAELKLAI
ncbi:titin-like [Ptychodera flava]|uniref:titin-like n=1 Tax=Ptychodera flava TaxID=63121 RepID=UPI00396A2A54